MDFESKLLLRYNKIKGNAEKVFFDICHYNWKLNQEGAREYFKDLTKKVVLLHREIEKSCDYDFGNSIVIAKDKDRNSILSFCVNSGFLDSEIASTHGIEWAFVGLIDKLGVNYTDIDFKFLDVGYKLGINSKDMPVLSGGILLYPFPAIKRDN